MKGQGMRVHERVPLDQQDIADFCRRHRIQRLSLFGSVLRDDFDPATSDIDFLVEFEPDAKVSLFDVGGMIAELTDKLGRQVDIRTRNDFSPVDRDKVQRQARLLLLLE
jgi:predicted nucleotidyltransferase